MNKQILKLALAMALSGSALSANAAFYTFTDLGTLGGTNSAARAINDAGQVAGWSYTANNAAYHATVWNGATATDLGAPLGGTSSVATAINTAGQVVGYAFFAKNAQHAAVWNGTTATDLNSFLDASTVSAGWVLTEATGINDNGWIVGNASNASLGITSHAFLLTPVPEAETYAMMLAGLGMIGAIVRRRKSV